MEKVSRKAIERSAREYLEEVRNLSGNGHEIPAVEYERALMETMRARERIIRARGNEIID